MLHLSLEGDVLVGNPLESESLACVVLERQEPLLECHRIDVARVALVHDGEIVTYVDQQAAERGRGSRTRRNDHHGNAQLAGDGHTVHGTCAAEDDKRRLGRQRPSCLPHEPDRAGDGTVGDLDDGVRRIGRRKTQGFGELLTDDVLGSVDVESDGAAGQGGAETAQEQVRVGVGGLGAAPEVGGWPWMGSG